jgi:hypothetical protein
VCTTLQAPAGLHPSQLFAGAFGVAEVPCDRECSAGLDWKLLRLHIVDFAVRSTRKPLPQRLSEETLNPDSGGCRTTERQ